MATIKTIKLCKTENFGKAMGLILNGDKIEQEGVVISEKSKIYFDYEDSVSFYVKDGYVYLALNKMTLEDRKRIKEHNSSSSEL